jgi:hypothetical protein
VALQNTNQSINTTGISGGTTKHKSINQYHRYIWWYYKTQINQSIPQVYLVALQNTNQSINTINLCFVVPPDIRVVLID